jgi:hypothetical protein
MEHIKEFNENDAQSITQRRNNRLGSRRDETIGGL